MDEIRPLPPFRCEDIEKSKLHHEWKNWKSALERYFDAHDIHDQFKKRAKLLYLGGPQLDKVFSHLPDGEKFPLIATEKKFYDVAVAALDNYFQPSRQDILERHRLRQMKQLVGERFSHYMVRIRQQVALCGFEKYSKKTRNVLTELMLADVIVEGCQSVELRRRMLLKDRSLQEIEEIGTSLEEVDSQMQDLGQKHASGDATERIFKVKTKAAKGSSHSDLHKSAPWPRRTRTLPNITCFNCGRQGHIASSGSCPAKGKQCNKCKRYGHFETKCKSSPKIVDQHFSPATKKIRLMEDLEVPEKPQDGKVYYAFFCGNESNTLLFELGGVKIEMLIDSGSDANMITLDTWEWLKQSEVEVISSSKASDRIFLSYGSKMPLPVRGKFSARISIEDKTTVADFYVVENGQKCLLGDKTAKKLEVLKIGVHVNRVELAESFAKIKDVEVQIHMDLAVKPVAQPIRRLPLPIEAEVHKKICEMLRRDIIEPKEGPTTWVSPLVVVAKAKGGIRLCVDLRRVNQAVVRERHPMPSIEQIIARLGDGVIWSKLDVKDSFLQVMIAEESRDVLTFIMDQGLYRFKRLPFGLVTAPEIFQKVVDGILCGCEGTYWYLDDIFIAGRTVEEHNVRLNKVITKLKNKGVQLNWDKCVFRAEEIEFLGHKITPSGITPSPAKVEAVATFRQPTCESEMRSFLGLANYLNKYIPNLAMLDEPLRQLARKGVRFNWGPPQEKAFQDIKKAMSDVTKLGFYNLSDRTAVIADAIPYGLGAILKQWDDNGNERVISFASKALSETEKRYCQTEKEALALVWSVEKFQYYLLGKRFELITDCKALVYLFTPRSRPCARIERWVLRLQCFDYTVVHIQGNLNVADAVSRLSCGVPKPFDEAEEIMIQQIAMSAVATAVTWQEVVNATQHDSEITDVLVHLSNDTCDLLPTCYRLIATELCNIGGVLMRGDRIVVPEALRQRIIESAHDGHAGIRMMKCFLRSSVWWPKLDVDVQLFVKKCRGCVLVSSPNAPEPMVRTKLPSGPWEDIAIDYLGPLPEGQHLLVVVDCYSRYLEVDEMDCTDSKSTIEQLLMIFSRYGIPALIKADNGPQFSSEEFKSFCKEYGIRLVSTIPYWPQMNGQVERQNCSILKRLRIAQELGKNWKRELYNFLLIYHATKHPTTGETPSKLMLGRRLNTKLPSVPTYEPDDEEMRDYDRLQKEKGKDYSDKKRRAQFSNITAGDNVLLKRMRKEHKLESEFSPELHVVTKKVGSDVKVRSTVSGKESRRNVTHLKKLPEQTDNEQLGDAELSSNIPSGSIIRQPETRQSEDHVKKNRSEYKELTLPKRQRQEPARYRDYIPY